MRQSASVSVALPHVACCADAGEATTRTRARTARTRRSMPIPGIGRRTRPGGDRDHSWLLGPPRRRLASTVAPPSGPEAPPVPSYAYDRLTALDNSFLVLEK